MTWRAISARPYPPGAGIVQVPSEAPAAVESAGGGRPRLDSAGLGQLPELPPLGAPTSDSNLGDTLMFLTAGAATPPLLCSTWAVFFTETTNESPKKCIR